MTEAGEGSAAAIGPLDVTRVLAALPHRYPMLLVDRVEEIIPDRSIAAIKAVTFNEGFFQGHFPGRPIMPGVLILEAMAQAAGVLVFSAEGATQQSDRMVYYYVGIDNARFKKPVVPGDQLELEVKIERALRGIGKFSCVARVAGTVVAEATILCSVRPVGDG
jgi:3-hydroxyacyl-[acyl-carrier-protein] dehydratase